MAEARKVFPMSTFVAYLRGVEKEKHKKSISDMLAFVTQKDMDDDFAPFAAALAKAWVYEQNPELTSFDVAGVNALGQSVSIAPMPEGMLQEAASISEKLAEYKATIAAQTVKVAGLEATVEELKAKLAVAEKKGKELDTMKKAGEKVLEMSGKKVDEYTKKLDELLAKIEEVKKHGLVVAGPAGAAAGGEAAGGAAGPEVGGAPEGDFGFGGDPFANDTW